jgi:hypothetical protein
MKAKNDKHPETQAIVRQGSMPHGTVELDDLERALGFEGDGGTGLHKRRVSVGA